jgi:prephenate dehydrogenase
MAFRQITIIGTGLIGGSTGLAFRKHGFRGRIIGCDRVEVLKRAKRLGAIHEGISDPLRAIKGSDVVILATPVGSILELIEKLAPHFSPPAFITDTGSTKGTIAGRAQQAIGEGASVRFLPGHPMAGKENSGIEGADGSLFEGAVWFVTPAEASHLKERRTVEYLRWLRKFGAKVMAMDANEHDQLCAWISHVPQMVSTALAAALVEEYGAQARLLESGGRALREMTRIAASPYSMWRDIAITNRKQISNALMKLEQKLGHIRENLDTRELEAEFERAHKLKSHSPRAGRATANTREKKNTGNKTKTGKRK